MPVRIPPAPQDLGGGVWSVPVPIPANPLGYTLVYAFDTARGPVLIDAGWEHPDSWTALRDGLASFGLDVAEVYGVVVTHYHPDHAGLAGRVREASGAWVAMHHADAEAIRRFRKMSRSERKSWQLAGLRRAGADEAAVAALAAWEGMADPAVQPDRELEHGDRVDLPGRDLRVVWTPGHTPGHICLYLEDTARLFTGDHVLPGITPHIGLYPFDAQDADPLGDFLDSLNEIAELPVDEVLPAHEQRFTEIGARIEVISQHHAERLDEVAALLSEQPSTLWEIAARMRWKYAWDRQHPLIRQLATAEAAAHLRRLEVSGHARRADRNDTIRFATA